MAYSTASGEVGSTRRMTRPLRSGRRSALVSVLRLYNGENFVAFKVGGDAIHPFLLAAIRFAVAAGFGPPLTLWRLRSQPAGPAKLAAAAGLGPVMLVGG